MNQPQHANRTRNEHRPQPFEAVSESRYPEAFLREGFHSEPLTDGGLLLTGRCPRCGSTVCTEVQSSVVRAATVTATGGAIAGNAASAPPQTAPTGASAGTRTITIVCTCTADHPGRPGDIPDGCGAYWGLALQRSTP